MKKVLGLVLVIMLMGSTAFGLTYKETYDAGIVKYNTGNYTGAITDFKSALTLTTDPSEQSVSQYWIGICYYNSGNIAQSKIEYGKVTDANPYFWSMIQIGLGNIYREEKNNTQARIEYKKLVDKANGDPPMKIIAQIYIGESLYADKLYSESMVAFAYLLGMPVAPGDKVGIKLKSEAWKNLSGRYPELATNWSIVATNIGTPTDWSGLMYLAKAQFIIADALPKTTVAEIDTKIAKYNETDLNFGKAVTLMNKMTQGNDVNTLMSEQNTITEKIIQLSRLKKGI